MLLLLLSFPFLHPVLAQAQSGTRKSVCPADQSVSFLAFYVAHAKVIATRGSIWTDPDATMASTAV
jgi:hypothetical protein